MAQKPTFDYDIIVIGSGAGGSPAASVFARAGKKVAIIEKSDFGGESPNWGDVPLGALLHASNVYSTAKNSAHLGLRSGTIGYNYPSLLAWRDVAVKRTGVGGNRSYFEKQGISVFAGSAHFLSPNEISVNRRHLSARKFLIATGAEWRVPNIPGVEDITYQTPKTIINLTRPPKSLFVIGSSSVAMEIAYMFSAFGTKVYLSENARRIMPQYDSEVGELIAKDAKDKHGMTIFTQTKVVSVQKDGLQKRVTFVKGGQEKSIKVDEILVAEGRDPVTDIGLENAGVKYNSHGISVNKNLQTSARHIFSAGNVIYADGQTHKVLTQSRTAAQNMLSRNMLEIDDQPALSVVFTQPQIAHTGLSEDDCTRRDRQVNIAIAPLTLTARSNITDHKTGFVKLISNKRGVLIGATIVAPNASDMIAQLTLAIRQGLTARQLISTPNCFISWTEAVRIAAGKLL